MGDISKKLRGERQNFDFFSFFVQQFSRQLLHLEIFLLFQNDWIAHLFKPFSCFFDARLRSRDIND
jgi:hypothetical protein